MTLQQDSSEPGAAGERQGDTLVPLRRAGGILVGELVAYLATLDPDLPVASECGCGGKGGWSSRATVAHLASGTATSNSRHVKIGWEVS